MGIKNKNTKGLQVLFYLLLANVALDIIITVINIIGITDYFNELISFSIRNVLIFAVVLIITLILTIIPVVIGQEYKNWSEEKQTRVFFKLLTALSLTMLGLASIVIYTVIYPNYPLLMNPFSVNTTNSFLLVFSPIWWFFSFNVGLILIFLLYIYLES